jgi:DNA-binding NarL/FixJ family response regulator
VLILTTFDLDEYVFSALQAGASGFLLKDTLAADLLSAIPGGGAGRRRCGPVGHAPAPGALCEQGRSVPRSRR